MDKVIILAGGKSSRFGAPKIIQDLAGQRVIDYVLTLAGEIGNDVTLVLNPTLEKETLPSHIRIVFQKKALGTGHAFQIALQEIFQQQPPENEYIWILMGDTPLLTKEDLSQLSSSSAHLTLLGMRPENPGNYGRIYCEEGKVKEIIETKQATAQQLKNPLCYSGVMRIKASLALQLAPQIPFRPQVNEFYITDLVGLALDHTAEVTVVTAPDAKNLEGINTPDQWTFAFKRLQERFRLKAQGHGALLFDPDSIFLSWDTVLDKGVEVHPFVTLGPHVRVNEKAKIFSFSVLNNCVIHSGCKIGPFAHIRPGSVIQEGGEIGNFVEVKNTILGPYSKAKHLTYLGDANIGSKTNIGAGVITCNYDGKHKHNTIIGNEVSIGANTSIIAPRIIHDGALIGAGSVITQDVPEVMVAIARARQKNLPR